MIKGEAKLFHFDKLNVTVLPASKTAS